MDFLTLGTSPVSEDNPAGEDVRYAAEFEDLQSEVDKLSLPSAATDGIDWQKVETQAGDILTTESKDLLVAAYFSVARIHISEYEGLAQGLLVFADILENFWETLFPKIKRMRGRIAAIEWWIEKSESALSLLPSPTLEEETKAEIKKQCERIDHLLNQYLPDASLSTHPLVSIVDALPTTTESAATPAPLKETAETVQQEEDGGRQEARPAPSPPSPSSRTEAKRQPPPKSTDVTTWTTDSLLQAIQRLSFSLLEQDLTNPIPYRLLRFSLWSPLTEPPPIYDGKTLIPPPDPQTALGLTNLFDRGDWSSMVTAAETQLPQFIFWLDLHRYSTIALENLGLPYENAAQCIAQETAFLLHRLPGLAEMKFADDSPFADDKTCDWLQSIALEGSSLSLDHTALTGGGSADALQQKLTESMQQAQVLVKDNHMLEAVALLQQEIQHAASAKARLLWRLALSQLLIQGKKTAYALVHFNQVLEDIETYRLEDWDPQLALHCLKTVWAGLQKISDKKAKETGAEVLQQITRIDPVEGLRIGK